MFKHPLPMIQRNPIGSVQGRLDHAAFDPVSGRIFLAARSAGSIEVVDITKMGNVASLGGLSEPSGVLFINALRILGVACADNAVHLYKVSPAGELEAFKDAKVDGAAGALAYDPGAKRLWAAHGTFISSIDPETGEAGKPVEIPGPGVALALETKGTRLFVSVPAPEPQIVVIDRVKNEISAKWPLAGVKANHPIALDEASARLFVATREPAKLLVLDTATGAQIAGLEAPADAGNVWYDAFGKIVYVTGGGNGGRINLYTQADASTYTLRHSEGSAAGARTSLFIPERRSLAVFTPALGQGFDGNPALMFLYVLPP